MTVELRASDTIDSSIQFTPLDNADCEHQLKTICDFKRRRDSIDVAIVLFTSN